MRKIRSDSVFNALTSLQREKLLGWLFEDNLGYNEVQQRVHNEFNLECSRHNLSSYYQRQAAIRTAMDLKESFKSAALIDRESGEVADLRDCSIKVVAERLLNTAIAKGETKELAALGRLVLESQTREIQKDRVALARQRFEFRASKAVLKMLRLAEKLNGSSEEQKIETIARELFGRDVKMSEKEIGLTT